MVKNEFPSEKNLDFLEQVSIPQVAGREAGAFRGDYGWAAYYLLIGFTLRGGVWGAGGRFAVGFPGVDVSQEVGADAVCDWREGAGVWDFDFGQV